MIFFLGSSIGNFTQQQSSDFFNKVSHALTKGDYFLLGLDLQKPKEILEAAYNEIKDRKGQTIDGNFVKDIK